MSFSRMEKQLSDGQLTLLATRKSKVDLREAENEWTNECIICQGQVYKEIRLDDVLRHIHFGGDQKAGHPVVLKGVETKTNAT